MNRKDLTRKNISDSFKALASKLPFDKITVNDICGQAGMSRQAFYYNFSDRRELLVWTFRNDLADMVRAIDDKLTYIYDNEGPYAGKPYFFPYRERSKITDYWYQFIEMSRANKRFYISAWAGKDADTLHEHIFTMFRNLFYNEVVERARDFPVKPNDAEFLADYFACASVGSYIIWVKKGMPNKDHVSDSLFTINHDLLQDCLRRLGVVD